MIGTHPTMSIKFDHRSSPSRWCCWRTRPFPCGAPFLQLSRRTTRSRSAGPPRWSKLREQQLLPQRSRYRVRPRKRLRAVFQNPGSPEAMRGRGGRNEINLLTHVDAPRLRTFSPWSGIYMCKAGLSVYTITSCEDTGGTAPIQFESHFVRKEQILTTRLGVLSFEHMHTIFWTPRRTPPPRHLDTPRSHAVVPYLPGASLKR